LKKPYASSLPSIREEGYDPSKREGQFPCEFEYLIKYNSESTEESSVTKIKKSSVWLDDYLK
jgi:hypothetical protein